MMVNNRLRIAIFSANNPSVWSGGRYHGLMLALALGKAGHDVSYVTNKKPIFYDQVIGEHPGTVDLVLEPNLREARASELLDFVVVVPLGNFDPQFYESATQFVRNAKARLAFLNFEAGNWYNECAPNPRDIRLWDSWRRLALDDALILSSTFVSQNYAKKFYYSYAEESTSRFEVWYPAVNSAVAERAFREMPGEDVLTFVRTSDTHKGAEQLLNVDPGLLIGRTLHIIFNGPIDQSFIHSLEQRFPSSTISVHSRISDSKKFDLLSQSKVQLFTSSFEGFGYPPLEAQFVGAEVACLDIPVLRETLGADAYFASPHEAGGLTAALERALERPSSEKRQRYLRDRAAALVGIEQAAEKASDIFLRSAEAINPLSSGGTGVYFGPFLGEQPSVVTNEETKARYPDHIDSVFQAGSFFYLDIRLWGDGETTTARFNDVSNARLVRLDDYSTPSRGMIRFLGIVPVELKGSRLDITLTQQDPSSVRTVPIEISNFVHARMISRERSVSVAYYSQHSDGCELSFSSEEKHTLRVFRLEEGADTAVAEMDQQQSPAKIKVAGSATAIVVATPDKLLGIYTELPADTIKRDTDKIHDLSDDEARKLQILPISDGTYLNGVSMTKKGTSAWVSAAGHGADVSVGDILKTSTGGLIRVVGIELENDRVRLDISKQLRPFAEGFPNSLEIVGDALEEPVQILPISNAEWWNGVWNVNGSHKRRGVAVDRRAAKQIQVGSRVRFLSVGVCTVQAVDSEGPTAVLWLDRPISPAEDGAPRAVQVLPKDHEAWVRGTLRRGQRNQIVLDAGSKAVAERLQRAGKSMLRVGGVRTVLDVRIDEDRILVDLDCEVPGTGQFVDVRELSTKEQSEVAVSGNLFCGGPSHPNNPPHIHFRQSAAKTQQLPVKFPARALSGGRPRALFLTICPITPADQGNRVVTFSFVDHLVRSGFDVDVVLQGRQETNALQAAFGSRVRVVDTPFPDWRNAEETQRSCSGDQRASRGFRKVEAHENETEPNGKRFFHPYYIVTDDMVRLAKSAFASTHYDLLVCNYTHSLRLAEELQILRSLPPTVVITHDALSNLPTDFNGIPIDTAYRLCTKEDEASVLNAIEGSLVLAISSTEKEYFQKIGVKNKLALCEFDGLSELEPFNVGEGAFETRTLVFHGSSNPMNLAALEWFVENCWAAIRNRVPGVQLVLCGRISTDYEPVIERCVRKGIVSRDELLDTLVRSTVAINPTVVGTGLKIKTIEAACLGLPSVCLPKAVEGIEAIADQIGILASGASDFVDGCVKLLMNKAYWEEKSISARAVSEERFSRENVYRSLDDFLSQRVESESRASKSQSASPGSDGRPDDTGSLGEQLLSRGHYVAAASVLDPDPSALDTDYMELMAGAQSFSKIGYPDYAFEILGRAAHVAPWRPEPYQLFASELLNCGTAWEYGECSRQAQLLTPLNIGLGAGLSIEIGSDFYLNTETLSDANLDVGWSFPEETGIWSTSSFPCLVLRTAAPISGNFTCTISVLSIPGKAQKDQHLGVRINGQNAKGVSVPRDSNVHALSFDLCLDAPTSDLILEFETGRPERPLGGGDTRALGLRFISVRLDLVA